MLYMSLLDQAHLAPESETRFNFQKYIKRSLEEDFKVVVEIRLVVLIIMFMKIFILLHGIMHANLTSHAHAVLSYGSLRYYSSCPTLTVS